MPPHLRAKTILTNLMTETVGFPMLSELQAKRCAVLCLESEMKLISEISDAVDEIDFDDAIIKKVLKKVRVVMQGFEERNLMTKVELEKL